MPYDAFISYSSADKAIAERVCARLEAGGLRCWIAPRNVVPGSKWAAAIIEAIEDSRAMVLIYTREANKSQHLPRELERAINRKTAIIPFRIDQIAPSRELEYFISSSHWLNASRPPSDPEIDALAQAVRQLGGEAEAEPSPAPATESRRRSPWTWVGASLVLAVLAAALALSLLRKNPPSPPKHATPIVELVQPADGAAALGTLQLKWSGALDETNLTFEVALQQSGEAAPTIERVGRYSYVPKRKLEGLVRWKVRPVWQKTPDSETKGDWSTERSLTYYASSVRRIVATRRLVVGTAESDDIFVIKEGTRLTGVEIEILRDIFTQVLKENGVDEPLEIIDRQKVWGTRLLSLLDTDGSVDLLASGISIVPERTRQFAIDFTDPPTFEYPQCVVARADTRPFVDGKLALERVSAAGTTTNETLARTLLGATAGQRLRVVEDSGAYDSMLEDLVAGRTDGVLMDKPYALKKIAERRQADAGNGVALVAVDITPQLVPGLTLEKIGFAVRRSDPALLRAMNTHLQGAEARARRLSLLRQRLPAWQE